MPGDLVHRFITSIERGEMEAALELLSPDVVYDNVPIGSVQGREAVQQTLAPFLGAFEEVEWVVHHQVAGGDAANGVVMNERADRFRSGERWFELAVAGLFVIEGGRITLWRDYFDRGALMDVFAALQAG